jgi:VanZ family protein
MTNSPAESASGPLSRWLPVAVWCAVLIGLSSIPGQAFPPGPVIGFDKLVHGVVYGTLGALVLRAVWVGDSATARMWLIVLAGVCAGGFGVIDEIYQKTTPGRQPDAADAVADFVGGLAGAFVASVILRSRRLGARRNHGNDTQLPR